MPKVTPTPHRTGRDPAPSPLHLEKPEAAMWRSLVREYTFDNPGSLALLTVALESHQRARQCREMIDKQGVTIQDRFNQTRPHPLLQGERDARSAFLATMRLLNLDL
jgi:phage terminase small subunit